MAIIIQLHIEIQHGNGTYGLVPMEHLQPQIGLVIMVFLFVQSDHQNGNFFHSLDQFILDIIAGGYWENKTIDNIGSRGFYWSTELFSSAGAYCLNFTFNYLNMHYNSGSFYRYKGLSIRLAIFKQEVGWKIQLMNMLVHMDFIGILTFIMNQQLGTYILIQSISVQSTQIQDIVVIPFAMYIINPFLLLCLAVSLQHIRKYV